MLFLYFRIASCTVYLDRRQATTTNALPTPCGGKLRRYVDLGWCSRSGKNLFCHRHTLLSRGASVPLYSLVVQLVHYFHYSRAVALAVFFLSNSQSSLILLFSYYQLLLLDSVSVNLLLLPPRHRHRLPKYETKSMQSVKNSSLQSYKTVAGLSLTNKLQRKCLDTRSSNAVVVVATIVSRGRPTVTVVQQCCIMAVRVFRKKYILKE